MLMQEMENRSQMEFFCVDEFVPQDHLLQKIDKVVDFSHIYDPVEDLYFPDNRRPSCNPVVLFKMVIIQHLYGMRTTKHVQVSYNIYSFTYYSYILNIYYLLEAINCHQYERRNIMGKNGNNEGSVYKDKQGRWRGQVRVPSTDGTVKRKYFYGKTRKEVVEKVDALLQEIRTDTYIEPCKTTLYDWLCIWYAV